MSPWEKLIERPGPQGHLVQLYSADENSLVRNVSQYLWEGMKRGDGLLVIATVGHRDALRRRLEQLGADPALAVESGHLSLLDAQETLARFMVHGQPDWDLFENAVGSAMREVRPVTQESGLRAYGEMVNVLWNARQFSAAIRLEQFWNKLLGRSTFSLYCAYAIDVFGKEFEIGSMDSLLCAHTHVIPAETDGKLETAISRAMDEVLGLRASTLRLLIKANFRPSWALMPAGESMALWLRNNIPDQADRILDCAHEHYKTLAATGIGC